MKKERIKFLNAKTIKDNKYVIYWMQASQRVDYNHALEYAITKANDLNKPLIVYFGLMDDFPDANIRHYKFMIDGLKEVKEELNKRKIKFLVLNTSPEVGIIKLATIASIIITDCGYLRIERKWRSLVSKAIDIPLIEVESDVIVPILEVSNKEEYSASTFRKKITPLISYYLEDFKISNIIKPSVDDILDYVEFDLSLSNLKVNKDVSIVSLKGGIKEARLQLEDFISNKINKYEELHNHPELNYSSNMSPYLHFGQISPLEIYLKVKDLNSSSFLEELVVRRELAINFIYYNDNYDKYKCLPNWAKATLESHSSDIREYNYSLNDLETYNTHDPYWNSCQKQMLKTGKMHGYMRMYWGKKVIEWSVDYKVAYETLVYLNNKYSLDGRDANGYAGVAWCFGKHDRPWKSRPIFGMVRYMNDKGLIRKFDMDKYIKDIKTS